MIKVNCPTCGVRLSASDELINKPVNCQKCNTKFVLSRRWTSEPLTVAGDSTSNPAVKSERAFDDSPLPITGPLTESIFATETQMNPDGPGLLASDSSMGSSAESDLDRTFDFTLSSASSETSSIRSENSSVEPSLPATSNGAPKRLAIGTPSLPHSQNSGQISVQSPPREGLYQELEYAPTTELQHFRETSSIWQFFDFQFRAYLTPGIVRISWFLILLVVTVWLLFMSYFYLSSIIQKKDFMLPTLQSKGTVPSASTDPNVLVVPRFFYNSAIYFTYATASIIGLLWIRVLFETVMMVFSIGSHLQVKQNRKSIRKK